MYWVLRLHDFVSLTVNVPDQEGQNCWCRHCYIVWAKGAGRGYGGLDSKEGQLIPGKGPEWMGIRHHEQDSGLPSKWGVFFYLWHEGLCPNSLLCVMLIKRQNFCVQVKNKSCVVYIIMRLILWKCPRGSETGKFNSNVLRRWNNFYTSLVLESF